MDDEYKYSIVCEGPLVQVATSGEFDYLKALQMWKEIIAICEEHQCFRILATSGITKPLPVPDVFNSQEFFDTVGITSEYCLAVVSETAAVRESHEVAAAALRMNRAAAPFKAAAFTSEWEARRWLDNAD